MNVAATSIPGSTSHMFGPLTFDEAKYNYNNFGDTETECFLCEDSFNLNVSFNIFLKHIFDVHNLVVEEIQNIKNLKEYIGYWREKFKKIPYEQIVPSIKVGQENEKFYLLSTLQEEDQKLRQKLKLEHALKIQEFERTDKNYIRQCLFCRVIFEGTRHGYVEHLSTQHNLQLGNPQNLVFIEELIDKLDEVLNNLKCIYCEKMFPDRNILKEHMRKKLHKRIYVKNKSYDQFYIVNYLEPESKKEIDADDTYCIPMGSEDNINPDEEYFDWTDKEVSINCLLCDHSETNINNLCLHMDADHEFDFVLATQDFDYYQKIKLVNYVRRQIHNHRCIFCDKEFENGEVLRRHMVNEKHYKLPEPSIFNQPEYYFPTFENDAFLYFIDDVED